MITFKSKKMKFLIGILAGILGFGIYNVFFKQEGPKKNIVERLQNVVNTSVDKKKVFGSNFAIKRDDFVWYGSAGNMSNDQPYFIASTTKLFTTAIILHLQSEKKLNLEDTIDTYLDDSILAGLHTYKEIDFSKNITIKQLLAHTSGIPDYFQGKGPNGKSLEEELMSGIDQSWTFEEALNRSKDMKPLFAPGTPGKAHYSDTNFILLGRIIENITQKSYIQNCEELIFSPLGLKSTYVYKDPTDTKPKIMYYKKKELNIPKAMTSFGPDGSIVSTSEDMLVFIEAFFTGKLFPIEYIPDLQTWNKIFFPMQSGIGIHKFQLPWIFDPTHKIPYIIGHSGLSGALAFYSPEKNIFIVGTVNQIASPDASFQVAIKLILELLQD